jgi:hypothetical protein
MRPNQILALIIGLIGLVGMFFFPSPEDNFLYYAGFIGVVVILIILVLKTDKKIKGK